jgi:hypothetical protein
MVLFAGRLPAATCLLYRIDKINYTRWPWKWSALNFTQPTDFRMRRIEQYI